MSVGDFVSDFFLVVSRSMPCDKIKTIYLIHNQMLAIFTITFLLIEILILIDFTPSTLSSNPSGPLFSFGHKTMVIELPDVGH